MVVDFLSVSSMNFAIPDCCSPDLNPGPLQSDQFTAPESRSQSRKEERAAGCSTGECLASQELDGRGCRCRASSGVSGVQRLPHAVERRRPGDSHLQSGQSRVREAAVIPVFDSTLGMMDGILP